VVWVHPLFFFSSPFFPPPPSFFLTDGTDLAVIVLAANQLDEPVNYVSFPPFSPLSFSSPERWAGRGNCLNFRPGTDAAAVGEGKS